MAIGIGKLRQRVHVLAPVPTTDQYGQAKASYTTLHESVAASVNPIEGDKGFEAKQVYPSVTHVVVMRFTPTIKADMVIEYDGRRFRIKAVIDVEERHEQLRLMCEERADGVRA